MNKEFSERIETQKKFIIDQKKGKKVSEIEDANKKLEKEKNQLEEQKREKEIQKRITEENFKGTGIIEFLEQICIDGTLPLDSFLHREQIKVPIKNFFRKTIYSEWEWKNNPCCVDYHGDCLVVEIERLSSAEDNSFLCEELTILKREKVFDFNYRQKMEKWFGHPKYDSFEFSTESSEEVLDGIARVAAMYQLGKEK